jgi:peptide deformylase
MIVQKGFPTLKQVADDVPMGADVSDIVSEMRLELSKTTGIGLAANQIGCLKRIILMNCNGFMGVVINPVITKRSGKVKNSTEGCLSYPGKQVKVKRDNQVVVTGFNEHWEPVSKKCKALTAFCVQHEIDHLNGITI